jgi:hypothetical protein
LPSAAGGSGVVVRHGLASFHSGRFGEKYFIRKKKRKKKKKKKKKKKRFGPAMSTPGLLFLSRPFTYNSYRRLKTRNRCEHVKYIAENNQILSSL